MPTYNPKAVEPRWQRFWEGHKTFRTPDVSDKPKYYILDMFPYPSGSGLHVGHPEGYTATDILARYQRMRGRNVLHPMGWDAFGLPAEQYAIETGTHPRRTTQKNIETFRRQIKMLGFSYDWDREVDTTDPGYFKWTQWIFLELFDTWYDPVANKGRPIGELPIPPDIQAQGALAIRSYQDSKRLAYQAEVPVNWCEALGTVLANEEVVDGKSERGGHPVIRMPLRQWLLRITDYAHRLIDDLAFVDWPESIKKMQRDWIGKSEGAEVEFKWIGKEGKSKEPSAISQTLRVFTTRPDTLYGATYMVLSPEHPLVESIATPEQKKAVQAYQAQAARKSDLERTELTKEKSGVFTGGYAINPLSAEAIPIWIADYVLATYGTGAIMAVPAHDERDFEFARRFHLPIRPVVLPPKDWFSATEVYRVLCQLGPGKNSGPTNAKTDSNAETLSQFEVSVLNKSMRVWEKEGKDPLQVAAFLYRHHADLFPECFVGEGTAINSGSFDGLSTASFKEKITAWLEELQIGKKKVNFKLRDWLFSRQRYWGEPFPILHEIDADGKPTGIVEPLSVSELPLCLPELEDYKPSGQAQPPLGKARDWLHVTRNGQHYLRETNTMPQWAGSCWYYLRYLDPKNDQHFCDRSKQKYWLPVDLYVGGAEHAVLHLLYSRFWHKVLFDRGHVAAQEPFQKLVNQGMILGEMEYNGFQDSNGGWISADKMTDPAQVTNVKLTEDQVEKKGVGFVLKEHPQIRIDARAFKMSKSRGNVINPDQVVADYGADSLRLYEMFMGPLEATKPWNMRGVEGVFRFLNRVWRLVIDDRDEEVKLQQSVQDVEPDQETKRVMHLTIKRVTEDLDKMSFNTGIAALMEFTNYLTPLRVRPLSVLKNLALLLSPFAPHMGEELWHALNRRFGEKAPVSLAYEPWPTHEERFLIALEIEIPVQINGKVRCILNVPTGIDQKSLEKMALEAEKIHALLEGKTIKKMIVVPGKLVNIVVG